MSKRKSSEPTSTTTPPKSIDEPDAEPEAPVEKKRKITADPRFVITMVTRNTEDPDDQPRLEFYKTKNKKGKFSILVRGEDNAYKSAIYWLQEYINENDIAVNADSIFMEASKGGIDMKTIFENLEELVRTKSLRKCVFVSCDVTQC
jgi:hypothetical protein